MKKNSDYVGIDEKYIPENEKYVEETIQYDKNKAKKYIKGGIIVYLAVFGIIFLMVIGVFVFVFFGFTGISKKANGIINTVEEKSKEQLNDTSEKSKEFEITKFNNPFSYYEGQQLGVKVNSLLNKVVSSNGKNSNHLITVIYGDIQSSDSATIISIESKLDNFTNYSVVYGYDSDGYINKITISNM